MTDDTVTPGNPSLPPEGAARWRIPLVVAAVVLVIIVVVAVVLGGGADDDPAPSSGDGATSSAPTGDAPSTSESAGDAPSGSGTPSTSADPSEAQPISSPVIDAAVKDAIEDRFPALVPSGIPVGWTVVTAAYVAKGGGQWNIVLTDADGNPVTLSQNTSSLTDNVRGLLGGGATQTGTVNLGAFGTGTWKVFTSGDQVGVAKVIARRTSAVVAGLGQDSPVAFAEQLLTAEDGEMPESG